MRTHLTWRHAVAGAAALVLIATFWLIGHTASTHDLERSQQSATAAPTSQPEKVMWQNLAGVGLPVSSAAGPHCVTKLHASCFAHTQRGASFAAAHLLIRTFAFTGPDVFEPTISTQVFGPDRAAMAQLTADLYAASAPAADVKPGAAITVSGTTIVGYRVNAHLDAAPGLLNEATEVAVLLRTADDPDAAPFQEFTVDVVWHNGDWQLFAPPWGDWQNVVRPLTSPDPADYQTYAETRERSCMPCA